MLNFLTLGRYDRLRAAIKAFHEKELASMDRGKLESLAEQKSYSLYLTFVALAIVALTLLSVASVAPHYALAMVALLVLACHYRQWTPRTVILEPLALRSVLRYELELRRRYYPDS